MTDYSSMTQDEFDELLTELVQGMTAGELLRHGEIYSTLSEKFNNEILDLWAERNPDRAYGEEQ